MSGPRLGLGLGDTGPSRKLLALSLGDFLRGVCYDAWRRPIQEQGLM